jgi:L-amino acid N-acyltransferase YncA|nr:GNAT family N-acetyltransferase [Kofleriaceae bacterium]
MTGIALRPATADDCARVWAFNFAPDVRAVSGDARLVDLDEHTRWYQRRLQRDDSPMWIVEAAGLPVGVVRVDRMADGAGRISIALAKDARGRGIGRQSIAAACATWDACSDAPIVAHIRLDNQHSRAAFESCGFVMFAQVDNLALYRRHSATREIT